MNKKGSKRWEEMRRQDDEGSEKLGRNIQISEGREG